MQQGRVALTGQQAACSIWRAPDIAGFGGWVRRVALKNGLCTPEPCLNQRGPAERCPPAMSQCSPISVLFAIPAVSRQVEEAMCRHPTTESREFLMCVKSSHKTQHQQHVIQIPSSFIMEIICFSNWYACLWCGKASNLVFPVSKFHIVCHVICPAKSASPNLHLGSTSNSHKYSLASSLHSSFKK